MAQLKTASTSYMQLAYVPEVEMGVTPEDVQGIELRTTGESLNLELSKETSKEINASRQTYGMFMTDAQTNGGVNFELSVGEYDPFIEALLMDDWGDASEGVEQLQIVGTNKVMHEGRPMTKIVIAPKFEPKKTYQGIYQLNPDSGQYELVMPPVYLGEDVGTDSRVSEFYVPLLPSQYNNLKLKDNLLLSQGSKLVNGVKQRSFSIEKHFTDIDQTFVYKGMQVSKASFSFDMRAALTGSFDFIGMTSDSGEGKMLYADNGEYIPSQTGAIIDSVVGMNTILFDGEPVHKKLSAGITKISMDYDNGMQGLGAIGVLGNVGVSAGTISCTASVETYCNSFELLEHAINQKRFRVEWVAFDREGQGYVFTVLSAEFSAPKVNAGQKDEAVMLELEMTALMHPEERKTIEIRKFGKTL